MTLIKSVLTSIPIFFSFFRVPQSVVDKLVKIQRTFKDINTFNMAPYGEEGLTKKRFCGLDGRRCAYQKKGEGLVSRTSTLSTWLY